MCSQPAPALSLFRTQKTPLARPIPDEGSRQLWSSRMVIWIVNLPPFVPLGTLVGVATNPPPLAPHPPICEPCRMVVAFLDFLRFFLLPSRILNQGEAAYPTWGSR